MSLISTFLVAAHHRRRGVRRATLTYLIIAQSGALCILAALALLAAGVRGARTAAPAAPPDFGFVGTFGMQLLTTHLFAFEVTGFVLLIAVLGVILMAARKEVRF